MNVTQATDILGTKGINATYQRALIYSYLCNKKNHPTAVRIFIDIHKKVPSLSKATVYNTMEYFHKNNIVQVLTFEDGTRHYDADTQTHIHFHCKNCGMIYDFYTNIDFDNINGIDGFDIDKQFINFEGICKKCKKGENYGKMDL